MTTKVRPACESDKQEFLDLLQTNLPFRPHARFFQWLYRENPAGEAMAWVAIDSDTNRIVGAAAAFPRPIFCDGAAARGYLLGDFCIHPQHRSLGLALALQRACLDGVSHPDPAFVLDFPSQGMLAIYKRLRIEVSNTMVRHGKLIRADRKITEHIPARAVSKGLAVVVNAGLRLRDNCRNRAADWTLIEEGGPWGEDFTQAAREWSSRTGVCVLRTADYLNWRYGRHPTQHYEMLTVREGDRLAGYLILHMIGDDATIDDLLAESDSACTALLVEATVVARRRGVHTLSAPWLSSHPGRQLLERCGFQPRETRPVVLLAPPAEASGTTAKHQWYFTSGDCEG